MTIETYGDTSLELVNVLLGISQFLQNTPNTALRPPKEPLRTRDVLGHGWWPADEYFLPGLLAWPNLPNHLLSHVSLLQLWISARLRLHSEDTLEPIGIFLFELIELLSEQYVFLCIVGVHE